MPDELGQIFKGFGELSGISAAVATSRDFVGSVVEQPLGSAQEHGNGGPDPTPPAIRACRGFGTFDDGRLRGKFGLCGLIRGGGFNGKPGPRLSRRDGAQETNHAWGTWKRVRGRGLASGLRSEHDLVPREHLVAQRFQL
jgi:hypothetical protein